MKIRPYSLLGNSFLRRLEDRVKAIVEQWHADWGIPAIEIDVSCRRYWEQSQKESAWHESYQGGDRLAWISYSPELVKFVQRQIFPLDLRHAHPSGDIAPIATEGAQKAIEGLADAVTEEFNVQRLPQDLGEDANPGSELGLVASGAVLLVVRIGEQAIKCLLNHAAVQVKQMTANIARRSSLEKVNLTKALNTASIRLEVSAGQVEVSVASLVNLALGDVISLPAPVDKPLAVLGPDKRILFGAYLGKQNQSLAIEVVHL